jgi:hypothetical protein
MLLLFLFLLFLLLPTSFRRHPELVEGCGTTPGEPALFLFSFSYSFNPAERDYKKPPLRRRGG